MSNFGISQYWNPIEISYSRFSKYRTSIYIYTVKKTNCSIVVKNVIFRGFLMLKGDKKSVTHNYQCTLLSEKWIRLDLTSPRTFASIFGTVSMPMVTFYTVRMHVNRLLGTTVHTRNRYTMTYVYIQLFFTFEGHVEKNIMILPSDIVQGIVHSEGKSWHSSTVRRIPPTISSDQLSFPAYTTLYPNIFTLYLSVRVLIISY